MHEGGSDTEATAVNCHTLSEHRSKVTIPDGITLTLQPAERLWGLVDAAVANRLWESIEALEDAVVTRCQMVRERSGDYVHRLTRHHWWPDFA